MIYICERSKIARVSFIAFLITMETSSFFKIFRVCRILRFRLSIALLLMSFSYGVGQVIVLDYDNGGNRIVRKNSLIKSSPVKSSAQKSSSENPFEATVTIGPNPTTGVLSIEISNFDESSNVTVSVFNTVGQLLLTRGITTAVTELNIENQPTGLYLVTVESSAGRTSAKIVKK